MLYLDFNILDMKTSNKLKSLLFLFVLLVSQSAFSQSKDTVNLNALIFPRQFKTDTVSVQNRDELIRKITGLFIVSGSVRFSGAGFPEVASVDMKNGSMRSVSSLLDHCRSGSRITFEGCIFQRSDGTNTMRINKSIFIL